MWILADCVQELRELGFRPRRWQPVGRTQLSAAERGITELLGAGPALWRAEPGGEADEIWSGCVVVADAPRSQVDAFHEALSRGLTLPGPVASLALGGRGFRGQRGRPWVTHRGNLFLTVVLEPRLRAAEVVSSLVMLPAVAVLDAIREISAGALDARIKWVNDILIGGRKIAGVLALSHCVGDELTSVVLGVGVNVEQTPEVEATSFVSRAVSLAEHIPGIRLGGFFERVLATLERRYRQLLTDGREPLFEAYRAHSLVLGRRVRVWDESVDRLPREAWPEPRAQGTVRAIHPDLSLELQSEGEPLLVGRGRVELV